jgi:hypothetical protein
MAIDHNLASKAYKLSQKGMKGKAIGFELDISTSAANTLATIGARLETMKKLPLTPSEMLLLHCLAKEHRRLLNHGDVRSPKSEDVSYLARKSSGWCAATVHNRLFEEQWNDKLGRNVRGLGFVHLAGNGYAWLTNAGWALVLAVEAAEEAAKQVAA